MISRYTILISYQMENISCRRIPFVEPVLIDIKDLQTNWKMRVLLLSEKLARQPYWDWWTYASGWPV